jgi:histidine ammonia-lyase
LIFDTPEETFHGGNFHGQYVAMACDYLNVALTEIGVLTDRQLDRLLDPHLNGGLPPFLAAGDIGLFCGYEGAQYLATSIAAENLDLAAPSSVKSIPSNGGNQDVVSMGLISARKSLRLCENVATQLSVLIAACCQASHFVGQERYNAPVKQLHEQLSEFLPKYEDDSPIYLLIAKVRDFITSERAWSYLDTVVDFGNGWKGGVKQEQTLTTFAHS